MTFLDAFRVVEINLARFASLIVALTFFSAGAPSFAAQKPVPLPKPEQITQQQLLDRELAAAAENNDFSQMESAYQRGGRFAVEANYLGSPARRGDEKTVRWFLAHGANPNPLGLSQTGYTPLHEAIEGDHPSIARLLVQAGANVNARHHWHAPERTPLTIAIARRHAPLAKLLLAAGADPNLGDESMQLKFPQFPLALALGTHQPEIAAELLRYRADPKQLSFVHNAKIHTGHAAQPIHFAAISANVGMIQALQARGVSINAIDEKKWNPLHHAVLSNNRRIVLYLLRSGTQIDARNADGETPLIQASQWSTPEMANLLLANGANPNAQDRDGATAMHHAVRLGKSEIVELLLKKRAAPSVQSQKYATPLIMAAGTNRIALMRTLLNAGAKLDERSAYGGTPGMIAARNGAAEAFFSIYMSGDDVRERDVQGSSYLHYAVSGPEFSRVPDEPFGSTGPAGNANPIPFFLIAKGLNPNDRNKEGETPLHRAARIDQSAHVGTLLTYGANPEAENMEGKTACDIARAYSGSKRVLGTFRRLGYCIAGL